MRRSKAPAIQQNCMRCSRMHFLTCWNFCSQVLINCHRNDEKSQVNMRTFHRGHTAGTFGDTSDGLRWSAMLLDALKRPCHTLRLNGPFSCDCEALEASQTITDHRRCPLKIAAVWPVCYSRWKVSILSCDFHRCDSI